MKIAHVISTFPPYYSGTGMVCYHNALQLGLRGHDVTVLTANYPPGVFAYPREFKVERLPVLFRLGNAPFLPRLWNLRDFDIVHLHHPFIFGSELVWASSRVHNLPYVLTHHNDLIGDGNRPVLFDSYTSISKRMVLDGASRLLVVSEDHARSSRLAAEFRKRWKEVVEVPNGVDVEMFSPELDNLEVRLENGVPVGAEVLLFVGALDRAHHFRRVDLLLQAVSQMHRQDVFLLIVGDGDRMCRFQQMAKDLGIWTKVRFLGKMPHEELPRVYAAADVLVLPSHLQESFGMVLIEAMSCARPVIASNIPGARSIVQDGVDGLLAEPGDLIDLQAKIEIMLSKTMSERQRMGAAGRRKVEERYTWEDIGERLEHIYTDVLSEHNRQENYKLSAKAGE